MLQEILTVKRDRFHLLNPRIYILQGNFPVGKTPQVFWIRGVWMYRWRIGNPLVRWNGLKARKQAEEEESP